MTGSSPDIDPIESDIPIDTTDVNSTAASSSSETEGAPSLLDSVKEAMKGNERSPGSNELDPVDPAAPKAVDAKAQAEAPLGELTDEELKRFGPRTQRRITQLLDQRRELTTVNTTLKARAETADQYDSLMKQHGVSPQDMTVLAEIGGLMLRDPDQAKERLTPIMAKLEELTGGTLPADLQERVALGYISKEDARELQATRMRLARTNEQSEAQKTEAAEAERARQWTGTVQQAQAVANEWEVARKNNDPDWSLKQSRITERIKLQVYEGGFPNTREAVVKLLDGILADVNKEFSRFVPKPREVRAVSGGASSRASAEPTTVLEAAKAALAR